MYIQAGSKGNKLDQDLHVQLSIGYRDVYFTAPSKSTYIQSSHHHSSSHCPGCEELNLVIPCSCHTRGGMKIPKISLTREEKANKLSIVFAPSRTKDQASQEVLNSVPPLEKLFRSDDALKKWTEEKFPLVVFLDGADHFLWMYSTVSAATPRVEYLCFDMRCWKIFLYTRRLGYKEHTDTCLGRRLPKC